ncbi:hypothetical protein [Macrococcus animalis]|uniref:hypothetical protein n=1 Tax=Macrococcus animalis TaxID=3395467 RepID=UPI0039BDEDE1
MKQFVVHGLYAIPLMLYTLSIAFLVNQPIELINPFEYYNEMEMPTLSIYIMMIVFMSFSMFGFIIGKRFHLLHQLNNKSVMLLIVIGLLISLLITRMSVVLGLSIGILILKLIINRKISTKQYAWITLGIYAGFLFIIVIPMMILFLHYESFLNVNQFQKFIEIYNKHHLFEFIQLNISYFVTHILYYVIAFVVGIVPGLMMGIYHHNKREGTNNIVIQALICLICGTTVKLLIFKFSYGFLQFSLAMLGSSLQGLGLILMIFIIVRNFENQLSKEVVTQQALLFISVIIVIDIIVYTVFTGIHKLHYPATSIVHLIQQSFIIAVIISILYIAISIWIDKYKKYRHS